MTKGIVFQIKLMQNILYIYYKIEIQMCQILFKFKNFLGIYVILQKNLLIQNCLFSYYCKKQQIFFVFSFD